MTPKKRRENYLKYRKNNPLGYLWSHRKQKSKTRGFDFKLTKEEFINLVEQDCHYCGRPQARSIDRKDSYVGYTLENCLPCCYNCNTLKMKNPYDYFVNQCLKIGKNLASKGMITED